MSLLSLLPVIHCKGGRAGGLSPAMGFPSLRALDKHLLVGAHHQKLQRWSASRKNKCMESLSGEKKKEESATRISPRELKQNCKTTTSSSKFFPAVLSNQNAKKTRSGKFFLAKTRKELNPQNHVHQTPPTQTNTPKTPKKKGEKKQTKNKNTHCKLLNCFSLENCSSNPNPREKKKQPKTSRKTHSNWGKSFNWVPWICRDSGTEMVYEDSGARKKVVASKHSAD